MANLKDPWRRLRDRVERRLDGPDADLGRAGRLAVRQMRLGRLFGRQVLADRLVTVAGHLTFKTLLGMIPVLVLFLLIVNFFWHGPEASREVQNWLFRALNISEIRIQADGESIDLVQKIDQMVTSARAHINAAAAVGVATLFYLAMSVLATIEEAMNRIGRVRAGRSLWRRIILFWLFLTLGPPAVAAAYYASGYIHSSASLLPAWVQAVGGGALALAANVFVLFLLYKLLPNVHVQTRAALAGAAAAGTLWHLLAKAAFEWYVQRAVGYGQMYGNLAVIPLFFLWLYVTWLFVLLGFELAYVIQNFAALSRAEGLERERRRGRFLAADFVALLAMALASRRFREGQGPTPLALLVDATGVDPLPLEELLGRLETARLAARTPVGGGDPPEWAWLPARDPQRITAAEVLQAVGRGVPLPADPLHLPLHQSVRAAYDRFETGRAAAAKGLTLADLAGPAT